MRMHIAQTFLHMMLTQLLTQLRLLLFPRRRPYKSVFWNGHSVKFVRINSIAVLPVEQRIEIATFAIHTKVRPRSLAVFHPVQSQEFCIGIALDVLQQNVGAVTEVDPPHFVLLVQLRLVAGVIGKRCFAEQVKAVDLLPSITITNPLGT
jgi:hypothetical protein